MQAGKILGRVLAGFVIAGALMATMPPPSHAADLTGQSIVPASKPVPLDPYYVNHKADLRLKLAVKWELALSPYVDASFIHVTVRDGVVTLRGSVEDQSAATAAIENAKEAGAKKVINKLNIEEK